MRSDNTAVAMEESESVMKRNNPWMFSQVNFNKTFNDMDTFVAPEQVEAEVMSSRTSYYRTSYLTWAKAQKFGMLRQL